MKRFQKTGLLVAACATFFMTGNDAQARPAYQGNVPAVTGGVCSTCHIDGQPKAMRNAFGVDFKATLNGGSWADIYAKDSDGDGYTNGQELGDPEGKWKMGDAATTLASEPGKASSNLCGNGTIDAKGMGTEECDGAELGGKTCADFGGDAGTSPTCSSTCTIDSSACSGGMMDMGTDMSETDMGSDMSDTDMGTGTPDMGSTDMGSTDMGSMDMGTTTPTPKPADSDDDDGCAQTGMNGSTPAGGAAALLGLLGMFGIRRKRRA